MLRPLVALTATVMTVSACGATSDKDQITQLIKAYGQDPTKLCTIYATPQMLQQQFGTRAACLKAASQPTAQDPNVRIASVKVTRNTAIVRRVSEAQPGKGSQSDVFLVKINGQWRVRLVVPAS